MKKMGKYNSGSLQDVYTPFCRAASRKQYFHLRLSI